jgi:nitrogen fixation/metabolism regulation signal transduction histidine kinase
MFIVVMPSAFIQQAEVIMSSDESLIFNWQVPDYLQQAINDKQLYVYLPHGIPELGMNDESLVIIKRIEEDVNPSFPSAFVGVGSIHDKVAATNDFYNDQKKDSTILMALIMLISALLLSLLSFFALRYLVGRRITKPVDELSAAAEEVLKGNLDVEIEIRKGEEFEGLKYAFKELLNAFRSVISQSVGED